MKQRPILFSTPMVQAILEGRKTMTRRIIKPQPILFYNGWKWEGTRPKAKQNSGAMAVFNHTGEPTGDPCLAWACKYGREGDVLWVRETWCHNAEEEGSFLYRATHTEAWDEETGGSPWKPSIHMPKSAARIFLQITNVRVERLQDISEEDSKAEGMKPTLFHSSTGRYEEITPEHVFYGSAIHKFRTGFKNLWMKINGEESWKSNHWVWVIDFKRIEKP